MAASGVPDNLDLFLHVQLSWVPSVSSAARSSTSSRRSGAADAAAHVVAAGAAGARLTHNQTGKALQAQWPAPNVTGGDGIAWTAPGVILEIAGRVRTHRSQAAQADPEVETFEAVRSPDGISLV